MMIWGLSLLATMGFSAPAGAVDSMFARRLNASSAITFKSLDANRDCKLDFDEYLVLGFALASPKMGGVKLAKGDALWSVVGPILQQEFNKVDKDKDSFLNATEYKSMWLASGADAATISKSIEGVAKCGPTTTATTTPGGITFKSLDANNDCKLDFDEYLVLGFALASPKMGGVKLAKGDAMWSVVGPILQQEFNKVDKDKDSFLNATEYKSMWLASGADAATINKSIEGVAKCGPTTTATTVKDAAITFKSLDANHDCKLDFDEYLVLGFALASPKMGGVKLAKGDAMWAVVGPILQQEFNKVDKDKDSFLGAGEYRSMWLASGADDATIKTSLGGVTECGASGTSNKTVGGSNVSQPNEGEGNKTKGTVPANKTGGKADRGAVPDNKTGGKADRVALRYTLTNVDYTKLKENTVLQSAIITAIKEGVLSGLPTGYGKHSIDVVLSAGSVVAAVSITPKQGTTAKQLHSALSAAVQETMASNLTSKVLATPNLNTALVAGISDVKILSTPASVYKPSSVSSAGSLVSTSTTLGTTAPNANGRSSGTSAVHDGDSTNSSGSAGYSAMTTVLIFAGICGMFLATAVLMAGLGWVFGVTEAKASRTCGQAGVSYQSRTSVVSQGGQPATSSQASVAFQGHSSVIPNLLTTTGEVAGGKLEKVEESQV